MWVIYGQYHERYCFVTLTFNFKVTCGLLKSGGPVPMYKKLDHPIAGIYNTYICPRKACMETIENGFGG